MKTYFNLRSTIGNSSWPQRGLAALAALAVAAGVGITLMQALRPGVQAVPAAPAAQVVKPAVPNLNVPISAASSIYDGSAYVEYLLSGPSAAPAQLAASTPHVPVIGTGTVYDGGAYGVARRAAALTRVPYEAGWELYDNGWAGGPRTAPQSQTGSGAYGAARHPNVPVVGTGSAYDSGAYGVRRPALPNLNVQVGTGLVSDGSAYMEYLIEQAARRSMGPARPAAPNPNVAVVGTSSAYNGGSYSTARPVVQAQPIGLGIDLPASVNLRELPTGLTDYVRRSP